MNWKTAAADDKLTLIRAVQAIEPALRFPPGQTSVETLSLPFYPNTLLLRFDKDLPQAAPLWYLKLPREIVALEGSIANIHYANAAAPLRLTAETVADYLKFYLYFARRSWLDGAVIAPQEENGFRATARLRDGSGAYEALCDISPRGEMRELKKERISSQGRPLPPLFTLADC
jgi:hypothetical protein